MKKIAFTVIAILCLCEYTQAQTFFVEADAVSKYIWRGQDSGNAALQPCVGVELGGFTFSAWGSTQFKDKNNEVNLTLTYEFNNLMLFFNDMYTQNDDEKSDFFNFTPRTSGHVFDAGLIYTISERFPLSAGWYTVVAGNDYKGNDKRAWSSYIELKYPFDIAGIDFEMEAGASPWKGMYADKFDIVNLAMKASKSFSIIPKINTAVFGQMISNPNANDTYFVAGINISL